MTMQGSRYDLLAEIGRNHYAIVHDGYDFNTKREVAIMELLPRFRSDSSRWAEIWRQTLDLTDAKLENVVPIHDAVEERAWIVMEKMRGNLAEQARKRALTGDEVRSVLRQVLVALKSYHSLEVIHGDVKPPNLLYNQEGMVKLSFSPGLVLGGQVPQRQKDFKYLAPETLNPQLGELGPQADLYSLGFAAAELLCGTKFDSHFKGVSTGAVDPDAAWMRWHVTPEEELPSLTELAPSAPPDLVNVIDRLVRKSVGERYESAQAALDDLANQPLVVISGTQSQPRAETPATPMPVVGGSVGTNAGAKPKSKATPSKPVSVHKPWSQAWLNEKLENPYVLYPVIAAILIPTLLFLFGDAGPPQPLAVRLLSDPAGAFVVVDDEEYPGTAPMKVELLPGEHVVSMTMDGYEAATKTITVSREAEMFPLYLEAKPTKPETKEPPPEVVDTDEKPPGGVPNWMNSLMSKADDSKGKDKPETPPVMATGKLPPGLEPAEGTETHATLDVPLRAVSTRTFSDGSRLEFVLIEPGESPFGSANPVRGELEQSASTLTEPFYLATTEVSNAQFRAFADDQPDSGDQSWQDAAADLPDGGAGYPVRNVSHAQSMQFCAWISESGRLPSETEWEAAARGGTDRLYPWGNEPSPSAEIANLAFLGERELRPVGDSPEGATPSGLLNMLGNVAEWCSDIYAAGHDDNGAPGVGVNPAIRGGSFLEDPDLKPIRVTTRANVRPEGAPDVGFRVAVGLSAKP